MTQDKIRRYINNPNVWKLCKIILDEGYPNSLLELKKTKCRKSGAYQILTGNVLSQEGDKYYNKIKQILTKKRFKIEFSKLKKKKHKKLNNQKKYYRICVKISNRGNVIDYSCQCFYHLKRNFTENGCMYMCKHVGVALLVRTEH